MRMANAGDSTILYLMKDFDLKTDADKDKDGVSEVSKVLMILNATITVFALLKLIAFLRTFEST